MLMGNYGGKATADGPKKTPDSVRKTIKPRYKTFEGNVSGVGVIDKSAAILTVLEAGAATLAQLVEFTGLPRPTAHRIILSLIQHRLISRDSQKRFVLGERITELAKAVGEDRLITAADGILSSLRDSTGESAQLFRRQGRYRVCVATAERTAGLRDTIPIGMQLSMLAGSAAQVLLAWEEPNRRIKGLVNARFNARTLSTVRRQGWAQSTGEREAFIASVSAPVFKGSRVIAAVSVSGPIMRMGGNPGEEYAQDVVKAAGLLTTVLKD